MRALIMASALLLAGTACQAQDWQIYNRIHGRVQELDAASLRARDGKVFFIYRERWLDASLNIPATTIRAAVDCAARQRSDVDAAGEITMRDIYAGTGQAAQADLACQLAAAAPAGGTSAADATPMPGSVIRLVDPPKPRIPPPAGSTPASRPPPKVAFIYVGPVAAGGWTSAHEEGRRAVQAQFAGRVEATRVENVPEGEAAAPVIQRLIDEGHLMIFATAFGYQEAIVRAAHDNPRVRFVQVEGYKTAPNLRTYDVRTSEGAYLAGALAGRTTRSDILGFVASVPIPDSIRNINAFTLGARSTNPRARVRVFWVGEWFNPGKERDGARALLQSGADVLIQNTDSGEVLAAAQSQGKRAIGWNSDPAAAGTKAHLGSVALNWGPYYVKAIRDAMEGKWDAGRERWGVREDAVRLVALAPDVPNAVRQQIAQLQASLAAGSFQVWQGPINNNQGRSMVEPGMAIGDERLETMYFYVEGVEGDLPRRR
jgi:basic membrane protein A and related proteins